ncbi:dihydrofolate reductase family protein [Allokutzneria sp. A3M-2-11 16]|uniref:dihydrofolate reductase family protein n=1 Tax=Allokutzneria sp. A3M-2-11 16 TaxID=2962043 RepID=UPI0020B71ECB|nr:dihydrofolate reductase family protein [Allokutzneria sp. A3M-2-11 16]MCP3804410.1 dihydrofolate reductase family protein [Allokutzneria sp. A3M-2-11 16]
MRKLTYFVATTIDGFISGPNHEFDFFPMEGDHITAVCEEYPEGVPTHVRPMLGMPEDTPNRRFDTVLMGRGTYDPGLPHGITSPYSHLRQVVFSTSLAPVPGIEIVAGDPVARVRSLKAEEGMGIWLCGGGNLAAQLRDEIDELVLKVNPVACGSGTPLFSGDFRPDSFALQSVRHFETGVVWLHYTR